MPSEMLPLGGEHSRAVRLSTAHPSLQHLDCSQTCRRFSIAEVSSIGRPAPAAILQKNNLYYLAQIRSEEHTSELQSLLRTSYAAFCLKNKKKTTYTRTQVMTNSFDAFLL